MPEYKLDLSYSRERGVSLHVFDLESDEDGPLETCSVGEELDAQALREAWVEYLDERSATEMLGENESETSKN